MRFLKGFAEAGVDFEDCEERDAGDEKSDVEHCLVPIEREGGQNRIGFRWGAARAGIKIPYKSRQKLTPVSIRPRTCDVAEPEPNASPGVVSLSPT